MKIRGRFDEIFLFTLHSFHSLHDLLLYLFKCIWIFFVFRNETNWMNKQIKLKNKDMSPKRKLCPRRKQIKDTKSWLSFMLSFEKVWNRSLTQNNINRKTIRRKAQTLSLVFILYRYIFAFCIWEWAGGHIKKREKRVIFCLVYLATVK